MHKLFYFFKVFFVLFRTFSQKAFSRSERHLYLNALITSYYYLRNSKIRKVDFEEILWGDNIFINDTPMKNGNVTYPESIAIARIIKTFNPEKIFEIGTFDGRTTLNIAMNSSENSKVFTLDLPQNIMHNTKFRTNPNEHLYIKKERSGLIFHGHSKAERIITQLYGDSATFDYTPYVGQMDLVFIDGAHTYDYVLSDTKIALKLLKPTGGIIIWHDYNSITYTGVTKAINYLSENENFFKSIKIIKGTSIAFIDTRKTMNK
jgi:predicted O-methyltransferase YrrM